MEIRYLFNSVKLNDAEKSYLEQKAERIGKLLKNYSENELTYEVEVAQDKKGFFTVEIMIKTPHNLYRARKSDKNLMNATDQADEAMKAQIRRDKDKVKELRERGSRSIKKKFTISENARF